MIKQKRALIILGGEFPAPAWARAQFSAQDLVIAADHGGELAQAAGIPIDVLLGDFDSFPEERQIFSTPPRQRLPFPCDKDYSDGELALLCARERGCSEVIFLAALGGRLDHCLFNAVALLEKADQLGIKASIISPGGCAFQLGSGQERALASYLRCLCSVISLDPETTVSLEGLRYSAPSLSLQRSSTRGLSNVIEQENARIRVASGRALIVITAPDPTARSAGR